MLRWSTVGAHLLLLVLALVLLDAQVVNWSWSNNLEDESSAVQESELLKTQAKLKLSIDIPQ